jgi:hypothetical protein
MNLQALAAMDDCEHATGLTLQEHERRRTPKEILGDDLLRKLKDAGYSVVQRVEKIPS